MLGVVGTKTERFRRVTLTAADLAQLAIQSATLAFDGDFEPGEFDLYAELTRLIGRQNAAASARGEDTKARAVGLLIEF